MFDISDISSPLGSASHSKQVSGHVIHDLREKDANASLMVRDLEKAPLPHIDDDFVAATSLERLADENGMIEYLHRYRHVQEGILVGSALRLMIVAAPESYPHH